MSITYADALWGRDGDLKTRYKSLRQINKEATSLVSHISESVHAFEKALIKSVDGDTDRESGTVGEAFSGVRGNTHSLATSMAQFHSGVMKEVLPSFHEITKSLDSDLASFEKSFTEQEHNFERAEKNVFKAQKTYGEQAIKTASSLLNLDRAEMRGDPKKARKLYEKERVKTARFQDEAEHCVEKSNQIRDTYVSEVEALLHLVGVQDKQRVNTTKKALTKLMELQEAMANQLMQHTNMLRAVVETIDAEKDSESYLAEKGTGLDRPKHFAFKEYEGRIDVAGYVAPTPSYSSKNSGMSPSPSSSDLAEKKPVPEKKKSVPPPQKTTPPPTTPAPSTSSTPRRVNPAAAALLGAGLAKRGGDSDSEAPAASAPSTPAVDKKKAKEDEKARKAKEKADKEAKKKADKDAKKAEKEAEKEAKKAEKEAKKKAEKEAKEAAKEKVPEKEAENNTEEEAGAAAPATDVPAEDAIVISNDPTKAPTMAVCLYDFVAEAEGDLSVAAANTVEVIGQSGEWFKCRLPNNVVGTLPPNYIAIRAELPPKVQFMARVTHHFSPEQEDELEVFPGDVCDVQVVAEEWYIAVDAYGNKGMFPSSFATILS